ncbi:hypothetical protein JCM31598_07050 [Desulfonatronum parangueonense]
MKAKWVLGFTEDHAKVMRSALILAGNLNDFKIDFVCEMFASRHAGDVETERKMSERFDLRPDADACVALKEAFSCLVQTASPEPPSEGDVAEVAECLKKIKEARYDARGMASAMITGAELSCLKTACEVYARLAIGQGWVVGGYLACPVDAAEAVHAFDRRFSEIFFPELRGDAYYGINSQLVHDNARVAWDILQVVRQHLSFEAQGKVVGRDKRDIRTMKGAEFDDPLPRSRLELITCSRQAMFH